MLMVTNVWLAFSAALLAIVGWTGRINPLFILGGVFLIGFGFAFNAPAYTASVAELVGNRSSELFDMSVILPEFRSCLRATFCSRFLSRRFLR
jgi:hypothetical protein